MPAKRKLDMAMIEKAKKIARQGNYRSTIAAQLGVSRRTIYNWLSQGEADRDHNVKSLHRTFCEEVTAAEGEAELEAVQTILEAGKKQWQACAWFLERRYPDRWGLKRREDTDEEESNPLEALVQAIKEAGEVQA